MNISTEDKWNSLVSLIPKRHLLTIILTRSEDAEILLEYINSHNLKINMAVIEETSKPAPDGSGSSFLRTLEYFFFYQFLFLYLFYNFYC